MATWLHMEDMEDMKDTERNLYINSKYIHICMEMSLR